MGTHPGSLAYRYLSTSQPISDADKDWQTVVRDHKQNILDTATIHTILIDNIVPYEYRPDEYLQDQLGVDPALTWIFLYINNLSTKQEFDRSLDKVYVPSMAYISELKMTYLAVLAANKRRSR